MTDTQIVWLNARQVAELLGVNHDTLKRWRQGPPYHQLGRKGHRRYVEADVLAWLERTKRGELEDA